MAGAVARPRYSRRAAVVAVLILIAIVATGAWLALRPGAGAVPAVPSLAVLPMVYLGEDDSRATLAKGVTSDLTSALAGITGLRVASATSADALQQRLARGERVADAVGMFLEGVIQHEGEQLRIDARLVSAADGFMIWAGSYEGAERELVALQQRMRESVVASVREQVNAGGH